MNRALPPLLTAAVHLGDDYALGMAFAGVVLLAGIAALSGQRAWPFSATVLYLLAGVVGSVALGALGLHRLDPLRDHIVLQRVCEVALVVAVFGSGLAVERQVSRYSAWLIAILLVVAMPVTIAAIALFGTAVMGLPLGAAVLLGAVLAPTDPVLAGDVGLGPPGEAPLGEPRLSLHTEAGANDGLASPFVIAGLLIATHSNTGWVAGWLTVDVFYRVGIAVAIGVAGGWASAAAITALRERELFAVDLDGFLALAIALLLYGITVWLDGYGLVAVFLAGIVFRRCDHGEALSARIHHGGELFGRLLELVVLVLLGSAVTLAGLAVPGVGGWLLAPVLIIVIRPVIVLVMAVRAPFGIRPRLFLGFFGVRGVAAIYYATVVAGDHALPAHQTAIVVWTTIVCVSVSVIVHGVTATPLTRVLLGPDSTDSDSDARELSG